MQVIDPFIGLINAEMMFNLHLVGHRQVAQNFMLSRVAPVLDLNQVRCFVAVAEELHFGRAAARLHITQSPLSRQIQLLEHALDVTLFDRSHRRVALTVPGRTFLAEALNLLRAAESAAASVKRNAIGDSGTVHIGFTASSGYDFLPRALRRLGALVPHVNVALQEAYTHSQVDALLSNKLDLGLARPAQTMNRLQSRVLAREPLLVALPRHHPLLASAVVELAALGHEKIIGYSPFEARYLQSVLQRLFASRGVPLHITQRVSQVHSMLALVGAEVGVGLVPASARHLKVDGVELRELEPTPDTSVELVLMWSADNRNPPAMRIRMLLEEMSSPPLP